ncbi:MAG: ATP-binding protein, partial [Desulforhabdus sp.]|nr:ATP-binding protein [Desulforhabdus sp.]
CEIEHYGLGKTFLVTTSPIFNENGELSGIVHSAKDVTEKIKIEEELTKAQKLESVGLLAGGIAHDFNNILTTILGNVNLAKMQIGSNEQASSRLEEAEKACRRAKDLTHQLLTFSKGGAPIKKAAAMADLVRESSSFALMGSKVRCSYHISRDLWPVEIDAGQMSQVINNLIINACQAMPNGGEIEISLKNIVLEQPEHGNSETGRYVRLILSDQGIGIPRENLAKIFDPYFTTKPGGSGLGLSMAYSIIKRHDGIIAVDSKPDVGTTFYIDLPASDKSPVKETEKGDSYALNSGKGKILVMDDEEPIRDLVGQMLNLLGYDVTSARDGNEAIAIYSEASLAGKPFDAIIMDLTIPGGMGGKEALEKLRQVDPEIKAIVSSGYHTDPIMSSFRQYGFSGVIAKPYSLKDLGETLQNVLESRYEPFMPKEAMDGV